MSCTFSTQFVYINDTKIGLKSVWSVGGFVIKKRILESIT